DEPGLGATAQRRQRGGRGHHLVADACGLDDGMVECDVEHFAADGGDHVAALSLAWYLRFCSAAMASAAAIRAIIGARQQWQMARASASAASAGVGLVCSARILVTIAVTCALSALPLPVTAALTSLGVWKCTSMSRLAAANAITPPACAVPITVDTFCWANTRSIAMTSGRWVSIQCSTVSLMMSSRRCKGSSDGVRTTSTSSATTLRPVPPSMTDSPQRVNPGSTPITRTGQLLVCEHLFESLTPTPD